SIDLQRKSIGSTYSTRALKLWCSLSAGTISIGRDAITSCFGAFMSSIQFQRHVKAKSILWMRGRISRGPDRVLSTASRLLFEFCIIQNFLNSLHVGLKIRASSVLANEISQQALLFCQRMGYLTEQAVYSALCFVDFGWSSVRQITRKVDWSNFINW